MNMTKEIVICTNYNRSDREEDNFSGHPKPGYFYKSFVADNGELWVKLLSPIGMKGMVFDSFRGTNNQGSVYSFVVLNEKNLIYLKPESITYNKIGESLNWMQTDEDFSDLGESYDEEEVVEEMPLEVMMENPQLIDAYTNSILRYLKDQNREIYSGVVYSIEQINSAPLDALKTPRLKSQLLEELRKLIDRSDEEDFSEEEVDSLIACFFIFIKKLKEA